MSLLQKKFGRWKEQSLGKRPGDCTRDTWEVGRETKQKGPLRSLRPGMSSISLLQGLTDLWGWVRRWKLCKGGLRKVARENGPIPGTEYH